MQSLKDFEKSLTFLDPQKPLLLAFSGGVDSMALFLLLKQIRRKFPLNLHLIHIDHKMRETSTKEALELKAFALKEGVQFHLYTLDPYDPKRKNLEDFLRIERYNKIKQCYDHLQAQAALIAHHQDDQVETVLKRVFEGSFFSRFSALKSENTFMGMKIIRPLLNFSKEELKKICVKNKVLWIEDETNQDTTYLRAKMRKKLIPYLESSFGKSIKTNMLQLASFADRFDGYLQSQVESLKSSMIHGPFGTCIDFKHHLPHLLECEYMIRSFLKSKQLTLSKDQMVKILNALKNNSYNKYFQSKQICLIVDDQRVFFLSQRLPDFSERLEKLELKEGQCVIKPGMTLFKMARPKKELGWIDLWQGVALYPFFSGRISLTPYDSKCKKAQRFFSKKRIPSFLRTTFPIFYTQDCMKKLPFQLLKEKECFCIKYEENLKNETI